MTAPTVDAAINALMDRAWNVVYDLLQERGLLGDGLEVGEYTGIHSWVEDLTRYTVVHSRTVAVLFVDTRPVDVIVFQHDLLGKALGQGFCSGGVKGHHQIAGAGGSVGRRRPWSSPC